jgi:hypothetical protein
MSAFGAELEVFCSIRGLPVVTISDLAGTTPPQRSKVRVHDFFAVHESLPGTQRTYRPCSTTSPLWGAADSICSARAFPFLTDAVEK